MKELTQFFVSSLDDITSLTGLGSTDRVTASEPTSITLMGLGSVAITDVRCRK